MRYETGLDAGQPGETVDVGLLDPGLYAQRWHQYQHSLNGNSSETFTYVDEVSIVGVG